MTLMYLPDEWSTTSQKELQNRDRKSSTQKHTATHKKGPVFHEARQGGATKRFQFTKSAPVTACRQSRNLFPSHEASIDDALGK